MVSHLYRQTAGLLRLCKTGEFVLYTKPEPTFDYYNDF